MVTDQAKLAMHSPSQSISRLDQREETRSSSSIEGLDKRELEASPNGATFNISVTESALADAEKGNAQSWPRSGISSATRGKETTGAGLASDDWNSPDDPDNPHNWKLVSRIYHTIAPALFAFVV